MDKSLKLLEFHPLKPERWIDLEKLFGKNGAANGCWCMWWKQTRSEFKKQHGEPNRRAFKAIVDSGTIPGLLAYSNGEPVGWCAIEPREAYSALNRSRILARVDDRPVWSVPCFFVAKNFRGRGLMQELLTASIKWAGENGAQVVEAYPVNLRDKINATSIYTGVVPVFLNAGFVEVMRRSERRPIMRKIIE
jgi:GNAT superfamily N-acetyltransferase